MADISDNLYFDKMSREVTRALMDAGVTPEEVGRVKKLGGWQGHSKNADDEVVVTDLFKWEISPAFEDGPAWPVVDRPQRTRIAQTKSGIVKDPNLVTALMVPDLQAGFYMIENGEGEPEYVPMHDPACIEIYVQLAADLQPDEIVYLGDNADLASWSTKFARTPTMAGTCNRTFRTLYEFLSRMRAAAPNSRQHYIEGNHEKRLPNLLASNSEAAFGVKRPGEDWPVLSIPYLLRFDELDIQWYGGYPQGTVWLRDDIRCVHGKRLSAEKASKDPTIVSTFFGHTHRAEMKSRTFTGHNGQPIPTVHVTCGTGARIDGAVPSFGSGTDDNGRPIVGNESEDWQQAAVVATYTPDGCELPSVEFMHINNGQGLLRGKTYVG